MKKVKYMIAVVLSWLRSCGDLIYWFVAHLFKSDFKNHFERTGQGKTIDIIVNGPSFAKQVDDVKSDGNDICMVNMAANTSLFWELKPSFYCVSDPRFFSFASKSKEFELFFDNIKRVDWNMTFWVTYGDYKKNILHSELLNLKNINFVPYHSTSFPFSFKYRKLAFWLFKKGQAMPIPMSVSVPVIMNAINTGYSVVNLYGYDQDWIHNVVVDKNNRVCLHDTHFYNEKGEYRPWWKNDHETFTMHEVLQTQVELFESYWFIKEYAESLGNVSIINRSPVSLIDAFKRQ